MAYGPQSIFPISIASGGSITGSLDLTRTWSYVYLQVPTMTAYVATSTCNIYVYGSTNGSNFFQFAYPPQNTSTTGFVTFTLANSISQCIVPIPNACRYLKIQVGNTATAGVTFTVIAGAD